MKKLTITSLFCLLMCVNSYANDKQLHYGASVAFGAVGAYVIDKSFPDAKPWKKTLCAVSLAMVPGVAKEIFDIRGNGWDNKDLLADLAGASTVPLIYFTIEW